MTQMPASVAKEVAGLYAVAAAAVPAKTASNLLIGTWNLRAFGAITNSWAAATDASPKRDWRAIALIAAVISHFDVVAVQEVRRDTAALKFLVTQLGSGWRVIASDVTEGGPGNGERLTFLYDSSRVQPSGLVGEIVLPIAAGSAATQFARTPYAASFTRGDTEFILTTVHIIWGDDPESRLPEIEAFAGWMRSWAERKTDWNKNLLVLGDFNLDRLGNPLYDAFLSTGLWPPTELNMVPRTIFDGPDTGHFYDQIAWFSAPTGASMLQSLAYTGRAGSVDFLPHAYPGLTRNEVSWRISDHYPLWSEFRT